MPDLENLPDDVIDKILDKTLPLLPTKAAFQVSFLSERWQDVVSSNPALDFDENDDFERHNLKSYGHYQLQHMRFINFLMGYLDYREKYDQKEVVDKLRLHMRMYADQDSSTINRWLTYACQRGLKELDISPRVDPKQCGIVESGDFYYKLPRELIGTAKSLTSLKLECVKIPQLLVTRSVEAYDVRVFPSLKTLSLKTAEFYDLESLLFECPNIEYLSLADCSIGYRSCYVRCSSLKSLVVKYCRGLEDILVDKAFNLESFTFVSLPRPHSKCEKMIVNNAFNLKCINICVDYLGQFSLSGCHRVLEAKIITKYVHSFEFFDGFLNADISVEAHEATILVGELLGQEWFSSCSTYFPRLMSFLKRFSRCKMLNLYNQDVQALIVPKNYRKESSCQPLPKTYILQVSMPHPPPEGSRDYLELKDSLRWIAPYALFILIKSVDVEADRRKVDQRASSAYPTLTTP